MTIKEMRAAKDRQEIGGEIEEIRETTPADTIEDLEEITRKTTPKRSAKRAKDTPQKINTEIIEETPEIIEDTPHALPSGLYEDITATIDNYCRQFNIDNPQKMHPLQWQGVCYRVGESIKTRGILRDREKEKTRGGIIYDGEKLVALLALYGVICADYKQVAFTFNFQRFCGVSREYFNDYNGKGLTSARVGIVQKAHELQKASLVGAVTGGGSATVGNIFLSKALAGLQETVTVQHVSAAAAPTTAALPVFDSSAGDLIDSNGD